MQTIVEYCRATVVSVETKPGTLDVSASDYALP
jgi:hypothetical protein